MPGGTGGALVATSCWARQVEIVVTARMPEPVTVVGDGGGAAGAGDGSAGGVDVDVRADGTGEWWLDDEPPQPLRSIAPAIPPATAGPYRRRRWRIAGRRAAWFALIFQLCPEKQPLTRRHGRP